MLCVDANGRQAFGLEVIEQEESRLQFLKIHLIANQPYLRICNELNETCPLVSTS